MAGVINNIRERASTVIIVTLGLALISFVLTDLLSHLQNILSGGQTDRDKVGQIAGEDVRYPFFDNRVKIAVYNQQQKEPTQEISDNMRSSIANQAWEQLINEIVYDKQYKALGLAVSDAEYKDMLVGPNPDPQVIQLFGSRDNVVQYLKKKNMSQEEIFQLQQVEDFLIKNRLQNKFNALVKNGTFVSKAEALYRHNEENKKLNLNYLAVNYATISDSTIKPSDQEYNQYYQEHLEEYKQTKPEAIIRYVLFPKTPTLRDTLIARQYLEKLIDEFKRTSSAQDSSFVASRSRSNQKFPVVYKNRGALDKAMQEKIAGAKKDSVIGPYLDGKTFKVVKISDIRTNDTVPSLKLRHILYRVNGPSPQDTMAAIAKAMTAKPQIKSDNFADFVSKDSDDNRTKFSGGDLGWYQMGGFGKEFDDAVKKARAKEIIGPIKSNQGFHIVEVLERSTESIKVAVVGSDIEAGTITIDSLRKIADFFQGKATSPKAFDDAVAKDKLNATDSQPLSPGASFFPGLTGSGVRDVFSWALNGKTDALTTRPIEAENALLVGYIKQKFEKGYKPMEAVKDQMKPKVIQKMKAEKIIAKLKAAGTGSDLEQIKTKCNCGAYVSKAEGVTFASGNVPGIGPDPQFVGRLFNLPANKVSTPIMGTTGVFIAQVTSVQEAPKLEGQPLEDYRLNLQNARRQQYVNKVYQGLRDAADIHDFRFNFGF